MPELLLELGCEELPASAVRRAYTDLLVALTSACRDAGILNSAGSAMGTPRRLIVSFPDLLATQPDATKEQRGPTLRAAFDADGNPTPALLGFCRSQGVDPGELRRDEQYVWVTKTIPGRPAIELLGELLPKAIRGLAFDKTMRWGESRMRFARPIRWILAAFGAECVSFDIEGVESGLQSRGHRSYAPGAFEAATLSQLVTGLVDRKVQPDPEQRRMRIEAEALAIAPGAQLKPALVDENVFLTEWPTAIQGTFREEYGSLPPPVLVTAMEKHERMFPVRDSNGQLENKFVFIRNSGQTDPVRAGCEWVLNARFNDAKFFFDEDAKSTMDQFLAKTATIVFQDKLGTVRARAERLARLTACVARASGADDAEAAYAESAGRYAKADLSSGLVGELTSLQGVVGGAYLRREGAPEPVAWAVATHYDLGQTTASSDAASARTAVSLLVADQLDKLAGYLGIGLTPTGSSDPFALRRAATLLIEAAWLADVSFPSYASLFEEALAGFEGEIALDAAAARASFYGLFAPRYSALLSSERYDVLEAAILDPSGPGATDPRAVRFRVRVMGRMADDVGYVQTATRPINIIGAARKKSFEFGSRLGDVDVAALDSESATFLYSCLVENEAAMSAAAAAEDADEVVRRLRALAGPITQFFDSTMVMVEDSSTRNARLTLLAACAEQLFVAGDFSKLAV